MICPACNNEISPGNYCGFCGHQLAGIRTNRLTISCLRADIAGFTNLTTAIDPEVAFSFLNHVLTNAAQKIEGSGGVIYRFIGDEIIGIFGLRPFDYRRLFECGRSLVNLEAFGRRFGMKIGMEEDDIEYARITGDGVERDLFFGDLFIRVARIQKSLEEPGLLIGPRLGEKMKGLEVPDVEKYFFLGGRDG